MQHGEKYLSVIVHKNPEFFKILSVILRKSFKIADVEIYDSENTKGDVVMKHKKINDFVDFHERYTSKESTTDVFYGKKKAFIVVHGKDIDIFIKELNRRSVCIKPKKIIKE